MNPALFEQAQAKIAADISEDEVLAPHARTSRLKALVEKGLQKFAAPTVAAVGILLGSGVVAPDAEAQQYTMTAKQMQKEAERQFKDQQKQAERERKDQIRALEKMAKDAEREAKNIEKQEERANKEMQRLQTNLAKDVIGTFIRDNGGSSRQARDARNAADYAAKARNGSMDVGVAGQMIGSKLGSAASDNPFAQIIGQVVGGIAGSAYSAVSSPDQGGSSAADAARAKAAYLQQQADLIRSGKSAQIYDPNARYMPAQQQVTYQQPQYQQPVYAQPQAVQPQASPGQVVWRKVTPLNGVTDHYNGPVITNFQDLDPQKPTQAPPVSISATPAVMAEVMNIMDLKIENPGQNEIVTQANKDPLLINMYGSIDSMIKTIADREATIVNLKDLREDGGMESDIRRISTQLANKDFNTKVKIAAAIEFTNQASVKGNYDTAPAMELIKGVVREAYTPDESLSYNVKSKINHSPS